MDKITNIGCNRCGISEVVYYDNLYYQFYCNKCTKECPSCKKKFVLIYRRTCAECVKLSLNDSINLSSLCALRI